MKNYIRSSLWGRQCCRGPRARAGLLISQVVQSYTQPGEKASAFGGLYNSWMKPSTAFA